MNAYGIRLVGLWCVYMSHHIISQELNVLEMERIFQILKHFS